MSAVISNTRRSILRPLLDTLPTTLGDARCIRVDPLRVERYGLTPVARSKGGGKFVTFYHKSRTRFILPGRWDLDCGLFKETDRYQFVDELKRYNFDYTRCARFRSLVDQVKRGEVVKYKSKGLLIKSEEDVHTYLRNHIKVCKSMIAHGYLPDRAKDHICVMLGRKGELIKEVRGRHRLAIAQVFQIPTVVVLVRHVHPIWVKRQKAQMRGMPLDEVLRCALKRLEVGEQEAAALI